VTDGVLLGATVFLGGLAVGLLIALYFFIQQEARDDHWAQAMRQRDARIDELIDYIDEHSDSDGDEVSAEDLWGNG